MHEWTYGRALYYCLITATTVGYGDFFPVSRGGQLAAIVHITLSVVLLAELLNTLDTLRSERRAELARIAQLERRLDEQLFSKLMERARELRPLIERDGRGLTELEFVLTMCLELELVSWKQVRPFVLQFRSLNVRGDGRLGEQDLKVSQLSQENAALGRHLGHRDGALSVEGRRIGARGGLRGSITRMRKKHAGTAPNLNATAAMKRAEDERAVEPQQVGVRFVEGA